MLKTSRNFLQLFCSLARTNLKETHFHQLLSKGDRRSIFNANFARNRFQEVLRMMSFDNAGERMQTRSPDKLNLIRKAFDYWSSTLQDALSRFKPDS